jgi:DNA replication protein DnaC
MKTKPAAKPKTTTQPTADTMTTTTQQAAEPTPAYAFSIFANSIPQFKRLAATTGESLDGKKNPEDGFFMLRIQLRNDEETAARVFNEIRTDFEEWITTDPEGIAAHAADIAHSEWEQANWARQKAEQERIDAEAKDAERQARRERFRAKCEQESLDLKDEIGGALFDTNPEHPDIDGQTMQKFIEWFPENKNRLDEDLPQLNAILVGSPGAGKSRALAAVALDYCKKTGRDGIEWITGYEFAELVSNLSTDKRDEANARLKAITEAYELFFDDLGSANFTTARTSRFFRLIDERYRRNRPTFFSTNYSTAQLKKLFTATGDSKDEAVRILRRIIGTPSEPLAKFFHFQRPQK